MSNTNDESATINLAEVIPPVRELLAFYDDLVSDQNPPIEQLDDAVRRLQALPALGGQVGRDIDLITTGGQGATHQQIVASIGRLRVLATMATHRSPTTSDTNPDPEPPTAA